MKKAFLSVLLCFIASILVVAQYSAANNKIYNAFKSNQFNFPPPPKLIDTVLVGEWDASLSDPELSFNGIKGGIIEPHGSVRTVTHIPGIAYSFSSKYKLKFKVKNLSPGYNFYVKINGTTHQAGNGKTDIYIYVNDNVLFDWEIGNGVIRYGNKLKISRIPVVVAGVFKIPLMPHLLIYEPPPNNNLTNKTEYTQINTFGSSSTIGITKDQNRTVNKTKLTEIDVIQGILKAESILLSKVPDPDAKAASAVLGILSDERLWGGVTANTTTGTVKEDELTVSSEDIQSNTISTDVNSGGPGKGDIIQGVKNARFLWIINDGKFSATMIDYETLFSYTANDIKDSINNGINKEIFKALAQIDPFIINGTSYNLRSDPQRYLYYKNCGGDNTGSQYQECNLHHKFVQTERQAQTSYTIDITDYKKGFLSYLNISPYNANETYKLEIRNRISNQTTVGTEYKAKFIYQHREGEQRNYEVFVDKVYGTFAVQDPSKVDGIKPGSKSGKKPVYINDKKNN
jgi:hypothetical protein